MFPLDSRKITGYRFGQKTFYNNFHLGVDYGTEGMKVYAPFNGLATTHWGEEGGNTIIFIPNNLDVVIRFMHLWEYKKTGYVREGEMMAISGNSGRLNKGPGHCHIDISKHTLQINNTRNFIDPEKFNWGDKHMQLVNDKGTVYIVTGNKDKRKIGIADLESLGLFGDEPQVPMDTSGIPEYQIIKDKQIKNA